MIEYQNKHMNTSKRRNYFRIYKNQRNKVYSRIGKNDNQKTKKNKPTNILDNIILSRAGAIAQVEQTKVKKRTYTLWEKTKKIKCLKQF